jgi:cell division protein FtsA
MEGKILTALDIGTTKVAALIARVLENGSIEVIGLGSSTHAALRKGSIINLEASVQAIREAVEKAEMQAGTEVTNCLLGVSGEFVESRNSQGVVGTTGPDGEITKEDVKNAIATAGKFYLPPEKKLLHVIRQHFVVDDQEGIVEPVGMCGKRLEAVVHVVVSQVAPILNLQRAAEKARLKVVGVVLEQLATSAALLDKYERELGVCSIDIGGGSADIAMHYNGTIRYTSVVPWGGGHITSDIASGLRIPVDKAESIKINYGDVMSERNAARGEIVIPGVGGRPDQTIPHSFLGEIITPRVAEILELVQEKMLASGMSELMRAGAVLTGGSALLPGIRELAEKILGLPVKIGIPGNVSGLRDHISNPKYTTIVGLLRYASEQGNIAGDNKVGKKYALPGSLSEWVNKLFNDFF